MIHATTHPIGSTICNGISITFTCNDLPHVLLTPVCYGRIWSISKTLTFLELTYFVLFMLGMTCGPLPGAPVHKLNKLCFYVFPILVQHYSLVYRTILWRLMKDLWAYASWRAPYFLKDFSCYTRLKGFSHQMSMHTRTSQEYKKPPQNIPISALVVSTCSYLFVLKATCG